MLIRILSALALLLVFNCSKPGGARVVDGGDAAGAVGTSDGGAGQSGEPGDAGATCAAGLIGTWNMVSVICGGTDITQDLNTNGGIAGMRIDLSNIGGSCRLASTVSGSACTEVEEFDLLPDVGGTFSVVSRGITNCQPAQCVFNANDGPCIVGDRASQTSLASIKLDGGNLVMTSQPPAGVCGGYGVATILSYVAVTRGRLAAFPRAALSPPHRP
jgi:hypothetical protein